MEADKVNAETPQALGNAHRVLGFGKVCTGGEVDAPEADTLTTCIEEMAVSGTDGIGGCEGVVQVREIDRAGQSVLIDGERIPMVLSLGRKRGCGRGDRE